MQGHQTLEFCSDLITVMTIKGARSEDLESVIRYSMAVIDSKKKDVDLGKAVIEFGIENLANKYFQNYPRRKYNV